MALPDKFGRKIVLGVQTFFDELDLVHLYHHSDEHLHYLLSEGLAKADSPAAIEGYPGISAALLSIGLAREWVCEIKTIGEVLIWALPLGRVPM